MREQQPFQTSATVIYFLYKREILAYESVDPFWVYWSLQFPESNTIGPMKAVFWVSIIF